MRKIIGISNILLIAIGVSVVDPFEINKIRPADDEVANDFDNHTRYKRDAHPTHEIKDIGKIIMNTTLGLSKSRPTDELILKTLYDVNNITDDLKHALTVHSKGPDIASVIVRRDWNHKYKGEVVIYIHSNHTTKYPALDQLSNVPIVNISVLVGQLGSFISGFNTEYQDQFLIERFLVINNRLPLQLDNYLRVVEINSNTFVIRVVPHEDKKFVTINRIRYTGEVKISFSFDDS